MSQAWIWQLLYPQQCEQDTNLVSLFHVSSPGMGKWFLMLNKNKNPQRNCNMYDQLCLGKKILFNYWNWSADILIDEVHLQWIPWSGDSRLKIARMTIQVIFFFPWQRRKKLIRRFPKLINFEVCYHVHVYPAQTTCTGALQFLFETVLKQIFFTNTILHFKSNHFKVNSSFPIPIVITITVRKLYLFLKLHLINFTLYPFFFYFMHL